MYFFSYLLLIMMSLLSVSFIVLLERKVLSFVGFRIGPNKVSFYGILQSIGDALKLIGKEFNVLSNFTFFFYYLSSFFIFFFSMFFYTCFFFDPCIFNFKFPLLGIFLLMSFNIFNMLICSWSVYSKFSLFGVLRMVAQLISYEVVLYFCLFILVFFFESFNFFEFRFFNITTFSFSSPIVFFIWVPTFLAELNRTPFDFSEGESELVAGFMTELGSYGFTMVFLSEYNSIIFMSFLTSFFFFNNNFFLFFLFAIFFVIWCRSILPRHRFDKLMFLAWKFMIPFITLYYIFFSLFLY